MSCVHRSEKLVKRWHFTLNNPTANELRHGKEMLTTDSCEFVVVGTEVGDRGTPHLQGFINMKAKMRLTTMKRWLSGRAHFDVAKGTDLQNDEYCSKEGDIYMRIKEPSRERAQNDLQRAIDVAKAFSGSLHVVVEACSATYILYGRGLRDYVNVTQFRKPCAFKTSVMVLVGDPGCGKTCYVADLCIDIPTYY